ncbi:MAG: phosphoenolpyruvate--protein phosphotransferase [Oscillospiraceae bacterium]|nr:phosphoenolpyruvate--protein phosphotransferase [Oscillospiraceae bacterium]
MKNIQGIVASKGIALGRCIFVNKNILDIKPYLIRDVDEEINKFLSAQQKSIDQLETLYKNSILTISKKEAMIFKTHQVMIKDQDLVNKIFYYIKVFKYNASFAVFKATQDYIELIKNLKSEYISQRSDDVKDITKRIINNISENKQDDIINTNEEGILVTQDLMPSEMLSIDKTKILGIITQNGGKTSHSAILAKSMKIPMVVGANFDFKSCNRKMIILDAIAGEVIVFPDSQTIDIYLEKQADIKKNQKKLEAVLQLPSLTKDKKEIKIMSNITSSREIKDAIKDGAQGVGLFRSEFLYLDRESTPFEEELFLEYKSALIEAKNQDVVIRTVDIGSDKNAKYLGLPKEENPALGVRALRLCFNHLDIFKTQLRALIKASIYGKLCLLIPMVVSVSDIIKVKEIIDEVKLDLKEQKIAFNHDIPIGVMIETPAAVVISDLLAKHVDFFSIGTNDLTQYTLACDRNNINLSSIYNQIHISILRMIKTIVDNAHKNNIWVEICGELAGDPNITDKLIGLGVDRLSVDPQNILAIKNKIINTSFNQAQKNILELIYPK